MSEIGASVLASNSDPKNADENDNFFDRLYSRHNILRIESNRAINSNGARRGKVSELLIANG
jgi:DNA adenine methylase